MQLSTTSTVIQSHPTNWIPDPQTKLYTKKTYQEHPHTAPTTFDKPSNKPKKHTTLKTENTNSTKTYKKKYFFHFLQHEIPQTATTV